MKTKKINYGPVLFYFMMFCLFAFIFSAVSLKAGDDLNVKSLVNEKGIMNWLIHNRYMAWSSRLFADSMNGIFVSIPLIYWSIMNSFMLCLLVGSIVKITSNKVTVIDSFLVISLIMMMSTIISSEAISWVSGSFNYLWTASLAVYSFQFVVNASKGNHQSVLKVISYFIALVFACYGTEQVLFCLVAFSFFYLLFSQKRIGITVYFITSLIQLVIVLIAPGNSRRIQIEKKTFYPDFDQVHLLDKIKDGLNWEGENLLTYLSVYLFIIAFLIFILSLVNRKNILATINSFINTMLYFFIYNSLSILLLFLVISFVLLFLVSERIWEGPLIYLAIFASPTPLYFSPTIYGSGVRTYFVTIILSIILIMYLFHQFNQQLDSKK